MSSQFPTLASNPEQQYYKHSDTFLFQARRKHTSLTGNHLFCTALLLRNLHRQITHIKPQWHDLENYKETRRRRLPRWGEAANLWYNFKLPIRCETAASVPKKMMTTRIFRVMMDVMRRMLTWRMLRLRFLCFFGDTQRGGEGDRVRGTSTEKQKAFDFRVSHRERDVLDLFHMTLASTDSCLLNDFHLKPIPVMTNSTALHSARQDQVSEVQHTTVPLIDSSSFCSLASTVIADPTLGLLKGEQMGNSQANEYVFTVFSNDLRCFFGSSTRVLFGSYGAIVKRWPVRATLHVWHAF